jgi:hypothetical protein
VLFATNLRAFHSSHTLRPLYAHVSCCVIPDTLTEFGAQFSWYPFAYCFTLVVERTATTCLCHHHGYHESSVLRRRLGKHNTLKETALGSPEARISRLDGTFIIIWTSSAIVSYYITSPQLHTVAARKILLLASLFVFCALPLCAS